MKILGLALDGFLRFSGCKGEAVDSDDKVDQRSDVNRESVRSGATGDDLVVLSVAELLQSAAYKKLCQRQQSNGERKTKGFKGERKGLTEELLKLGRWHGDGDKVSNLGGADELHSIGSSP